jgi:hypothetical protein
VDRAYLISPLLRLLSISRACPPSNINSSTSLLDERRFAAFVGSGGMRVGDGEDNVVVPVDFLFDFTVYTFLLPHGNQRRQM